MSNPSTLDTSNIHRHSTSEYAGQVVDRTPVTAVFPISNKVDPLTIQAVEVESSNGDEDQSSAKSKPDMSPWRPSILRIAPLMGLAALSFTVLQVFASYAVLAASDGVEVTTWLYQPTVYLAVLTAISNKTIAFAAIQGAVVTFWLRLLRGTTLGQMHRDWSHSQWVLQAICSGRNCSLLALACICATFVAIDGPLLQRATSVRNTVPDSNLTLSVSLAPELPSYFTGLVYDEHTDAIQFTNKFLPVVREFISGAPMQGAVTGYEGRCTATVHGPALAIDQCSSQSQFVNFSKPLSAKEAQSVMHGDTSGLDDDRRIFRVRFSTHHGTPEVLEFETVIGGKQTHETCAGPVITTTCNLVSAIAEYPIIVDNGIISFPDSATIQSPIIVATANNTALTNKTITEYGLLQLQKGSGTFSTLAGIAMAANYQFYTSLYAIPDPTNNPPIEVAGPATWFTFRHQDDIVGHNLSCAPSFSNPQSEVMAALNELLFRTGLYTASNYDDSFFKTHLDAGLQVHQKVTGQPLSSINTFHTNFHYFAAAAAMQLFTVVVIWTTFWGWWTLGRDASFSPLETGKAFDAPILRNMPSNKNGKQIAKLRGTCRVQYGILRQDREEKRLVIAAEGTVDQPFGQTSTVREYWRKKASVESESKWKSQV